MTLRPLMSAAQIADETGLPIRQAENLFQQIARAHGGPIEARDEDGNKLVRSIWVERAWVEAVLPIEKAS